MGAAVQGFVVKVADRKGHVIKDATLQGFQIEEGDDIESVVALMNALDFDPATVMALAGGVEKGRTRKFFRKQRDTGIPLPTLSEVCELLEDALR